ncbi:MAG: prepilin-type N-terminal cleavage/methylation domain-containing protein [Coriobacteriia bacterium]|nr:prepilin-type N-terminal cleavage/methylation domain-containing protein [Coriobacteriia bacterium]MCL2750088.1 prepilin-type N-terminal cleavage/methylation domain-containing protein [Coriobacteriia bacterium]
MKDLAKYRRGSTKGFTLVELIVVILILGILLAIAVPALVGYIDRAKEVQRQANARHVAQAVTSMFIMEGLDLKTASQLSFYSGNSLLGTPDRLAIVADLAGVPLSDIGFSYSAGQWRAAGSSSPEVVIHITNNPAANINAPGAEKLWLPERASISSSIYLCVLVGETGYYKVQLK